MATLYPDRLKILIGSASCGIAAGTQAVETAARGPSAPSCPPPRSAHRLHRLLPARAAGGLHSARQPTDHLRRYDRQEDAVNCSKPTRPRRISSRPLALCRFTAEEHVSGGETHTYPPHRQRRRAIPPWSELGFFSPQKRVILRNCGSIDPEWIEEAAARGAYRGALLALTRNAAGSGNPGDVAIGAPGPRRGRFPTGQKWEPPGGRRPTKNT